MDEALVNETINALARQREQAMNALAQCEAALMVERKKNAELLAERAEQEGKHGDAPAAFDKQPRVSKANGHAPAANT